MTWARSRGSGDSQHRGATPGRSREGDPEAPAWAPSRIKRTGTRSRAWHRSGKLRSWESGCVGCAPGLALEPPVSARAAVDVAPAQHVLAGRVQGQGRCRDLEARPEPSSCTTGPGLCLRSHTSLSPAPHPAPQWLDLTSCVRISVCSKWTNRPD